jgi:hypothetical protein
LSIETWLTPNGVVSYRGHERISVAMMLDLSAGILLAISEAAKTVIAAEANLCV